MEHKMGLGIVITLFNRPLYTKQCFDSLKRAIIPDDTQIVLVDDNSIDIEAVKLFDEFHLPHIPILKVKNRMNLGVKGSLTIGVEALFDMGCSLVMNLDNDAIVRNDFISVLLYHRRHAPQNIITGFNCNTKNRDGSERHHILFNGSDFNIKQSVGGLNMLFDKSHYDKYIKPALNDVGNWDHKACIASMKDGLGIRVTQPSVVQHIGVNSAMGHNHDAPDEAIDFKLLNLPHVTLIGVSGNDIASLEKAAQISTRDIQFGDVKLLSSMDTDSPFAIKTKPIRSKAEYNKFVLKELIDYVDTNYFIIFQPDGFILNAAAWTNEFYKWDMIGAWWNWYKDGMNCGNGGFSFRSKYLHQILKKDHTILSVNDGVIKNFEEDHNICRVYRSYLEKKYGIRYAPKEICDKFSIEAWNVMPPQNKYRGSFGFHSTWVDFSDAQLPYVPYKYPNFNHKINL